MKNEKTWESLTPIEKKRELFLRQKDFAGHIPLYRSNRPSITRQKPELMQLALFCLKLFSYSYFFGWIDSCFSSCFTSLELPMRSLLLSLFGALIFPVVFLFILAPVWQLKGVFLMPFYASAASAALATGLALTLKWSNIYKRNAVIEE